MKTVIVTTGGTREDIDEVRFLTNISTGKLGCAIAKQFLGWTQVILIRTETSTRMDAENVDESISCIKSVLGGYATKNLNKVIDMLAKKTPFSLVEITVRSTGDAYVVLEKLIPYADAVVHAMACGDFGFKPLTEKLKSNDPQAFIESLRQRIIVNPKILRSFIEWNPDIYIVSFKFEVGKTIDELIAIAKESMCNANGDLVVANDKTEMQTKKDHVAHFIPFSDRRAVETVVGKQEIAKKLVEIVLRDLETA